MNNLSIQEKKIGSFYNEICSHIYREFFYDHGGFLLPPLSHHGGDGWLPIVHGVIMVVVGGYFSCTINHGGGFIYERLLLLARATPSGCGAFFFHFPPNVLFELHGWES
jgi:hypothetical protein